MHFRNKIEDCQRLETNIGIEDQDIQSFVIRVLKARQAQSDNQDQGKMFLLIDDFDIPLLQAMANGYI